MKYCEHCGGKLEGDVTYCPNCGAKIKHEVLNGDVINNQNLNMNQSVSNDNTTVAAFVCSLIGLICCCGLVAIPGFILSIMSLVNMQNGKISSEKKGLAIAALILSILAILSGIFNLFTPNYNKEIIDNIENQFNIHYE